MEENYKMKESNTINIIHINNMPTTIFTKQTLMCYFMDKISLKM